MVDRKKDEFTISHAYRKTNPTHNTKPSSIAWRGLAHLLAEGVLQAQRVPQLLLRHGAGHVDLVAQHQERHVRQLVRRQQTL